jgi:hypothetical protein
MIWQYILLIVLGILVVSAIGLYLFYRFKKNKIKTNIAIPVEILNEFELAEKIFQENKKKGAPVDGHLILKQLYDKRNERRLEENGRENRENSINRGTNTSNLAGEPAIESGEPVVSIPESVTGRTEMESRDVQLPNTSEPIVENVPEPTGTDNQAASRSSGARDREDRENGRETDSSTGARNLFSRLRRS